MKKKILTVAGLTVVSGLALAGCKPTTTVQKGSVYNKDGYTYEEAPAPYAYEGTLAKKEVNVYLNYGGTAGVSYRGTEAYPNPINGVTYQQGAILPTWTELGRVTGTEVKDVASYTDKKDEDTYKSVLAKGFKIDGKGIDLFANGVKFINEMGGDGNAIDLVPYIESGKMPNFKAYLDANPTVKNQIMVDGKIFYTPYFDGYNQVERMFIMDTEMVQILVDTDDFTNFDATLSGKGGDAKTLKEAQYQPFINADSNYASNTKVKVSKNAKAVEIEIKKTDNIIKQQNASLANGVSGKDLAKQFKDYLKKAYGHLVGKGKTFEKYSDIFVSESAAYNADELVALMRVVKANPKTVSKGLVDTVECFFPRGEAANRVANILDLAQIWGIQGLDAESNNFFFDANGKLQSLGTTQASYDALDLLNQLYNEGLIVNDFYYVPSDKASATKGLDKYFKKTRNDSGFGFLMYDYSAATGAANDTVEGIGTNPSSRNGKFKDLSVTGIRPVVSPLTMWATEKNWDRTQALSNMTGKTLTRYAESNRTLKTGSWCIPKTVENLDGALRLMDVTFSAYGALVNTFGPTEYWYVPTSQKDSGKAWIATDLGGDEKAPVLSQALTQAVQSSGKDFWSFMRENLGATHGIGGVRNNQADFQATNAHAQVGLTNVKNAIASGAVVLAQVKSTYDFSTSVNVNWSTKVKVTAENDGITSFWTDPKTTEATNWAYVVVHGKTGDVTSGSVSKNKYNYNTVLSHMDSYAKKYLYAFANELGAEHVADFCKSN